MKNINRIPSIFYCIILIFFISFQALSQTDRVKEALSKLDTTSFKGKAFLNKSLISQSLTESFRNKQKNASSESEITLRTGDLAELYKNLALADSKDRPLTKTIRGLLDRSRQEITDLNVIPIGIVNVDVLLGRCPHRTIVRQHRSLHTFVII